MGEKIKFEKTVIVKDSDGITRQAFVAGNEYDTYVVKTILKNDTVVNPSDLPTETEEFQESNTEKKNSTMENKMLPENFQDESSPSQAEAETGDEEKESVPVVKHKSKIKEK
jgi:hypothetical protein